MFRAVCFDVGGVVVGSPITGIRKYEQTLRLPHDYLNALITAIGENGPFQQYETGKINWQTFIKDFGPALSKVELGNDAYRKYCKTRNLDCPALPTSYTVDGRELYKMMMSEASTPDPLVEQAIRKIKASGRFQLAALTNTFAQSATPSDDELETFGRQANEIKNLFDHWIESSIVGYRKPDQRFYEHALEIVGVQPSEAIFLDDIGINCKAAQKFGMKAIRVLPGKSDEALRALGEAIGMDLLPVSAKL